MSAPHSQVRRFALVLALVLTPAAAIADAGDTCSDCDTSPDSDAESAYTVVPEGGIGDTGRGCSTGPVTAPGPFASVLVGLILLFSRRRGGVA